MKKKPAQRRTLKPKHHRAAKAVANGKTYAEAAAIATGRRTKRSDRGVTVAEWMRLPAFRDLVKEYAEKTMSGDEWDERNAQQARGLLPTRIILNGRGQVTGAVIDVDRAMDRQGNALGKLKDRHILSGPGGGAVQHEHSGLPNAELEKQLGALLKVLTVAPTKEKRARK